MPTSPNIVAIVPLSLQTVQAISTYRKLYKQLSDIGVEPLFGVDIEDDLPKNHPSDLYSHIMGFPVCTIQTCKGGNPYILRNVLAGGVKGYTKASLWFLDGDCIIKDPASARKVLALFNGTKEAMWGGEVTTSYEGLPQTHHFKALADDNLELYAGHSLPGVILGASLLIQAEDFKALGMFSTTCKSGGDADLSWKARDAGMSIEPTVEGLAVEKVVFSMTLAGLVAKQFRRGRMCRGLVDRTSAFATIKSLALQAADSTAHADLVDSLMGLLFTLGRYSAVMDQEEAK